MRCSMFLCLALAGAATAFGQQPRGQENGVTGTYVFVPDGQQIAPAIDPRFQQPVVVQPHQHQQQQHGAGCSCGQCQRTVVGRTRQVFAKTHVTEVTAVHSVITHPVQSFNEPAPQQPACPPQQRNLCPPQNFCGQQGMRGNTGGPISSWDTNFRGYDPRQYQQQRCGLFGGLGNRPLVSASADLTVLGYGPRMNVSVGRNPPMQALPSWR